MGAGYTDSTPSGKKFVVEILLFTKIVKLCEHAQSKHRQPHSLQGMVTHGNTTKHRLYAPVPVVWE